MKSLKASALILAVGCSIAVALYCLASEDQSEEGQVPIKTQQEGLTGQTTDETPDRISHPDDEEGIEKQPSTTRVLKYIPPLGGGAPVGMIAGGSRGVVDDMPVFSVLAPDHVGLSVKKYPVLYWFLLDTTTHTAELTVVEFEANRTILKIRFRPPLRAGFHCVRLGDYGAALEAGKAYRWMVTLFPDPDERSNAVFSSGMIKRIEPTEELGEKLLLADRTELPYLYAESGIWYEALSSISDLIDTAANKAPLRKQRAYLLEQGGLDEISKYEMSSIMPSGQ